MRTLLRLAPALLIAGALNGQAIEPSDPYLASLLRNARAANPQLRAAQAARDAEQAKVPHAPLSCPQPGEQF
jgi:hypothetical protein